MLCNEQRIIFIKNKFFLTKVSFLLKIGGHFGFFLSLASEVLKLQLYREDNVEFSAV